MDKQLPLCTAIWLPMFLTQFQFSTFLCLLFRKTLPTQLKCIYQWYKKKASSLTENCKSYRDNAKILAMIPKCFAISKNCSDDLNTTSHLVLTKIIFNNCTEKINWKWWHLSFPLGNQWQIKEVSLRQLEKLENRETLSRISAKTAVDRSRPSWEKGSQECDKFWSRKLSLSLVKIFLESWNLSKGLKDMRVSLTDSLQKSIQEVC